MRFIGKQAELGCTYQMGWPKFRGTCEGFGFVPPQKMIDEFKGKYWGYLSQAEISLQNGGSFSRGPFDMAKENRTKDAKTIIIAKANRMGGGERRIALCRLPQALGLLLKVRESGRVTHVGRQTRVAPDDLVHIQHMLVLRGPVGQSRALVVLRQIRHFFGRCGHTSGHTRGSRD